MQHDETSERQAADLHVPVMRDRIVELLAPALGREGATAVDGTLGMGGHTEALLTAFPGLTVLGIDRDHEALTLAGRRLERFGDRFVPVHAVYDEVYEIVAAHGRPSEGAAAGPRVIDGALFDLGVSSLQLDARERGFAYRHDAPLDMRMNQSEGPTAADVLNTAGVEELTRILRSYGEERFAHRIAQAIVRERAVEPFTTSERLVRLLHDTVPAASQRTGGHPAKRTFQALRIEVNGELETWERALPSALAALAVGGRIAILSYHSLEDRITKQTLAAGAVSSAPAGLPVELPEHAPWLRLVTRGAEQPDAAESAENPRAASARLRVAEKTRTTPEPTARPVRRTRPGKGSLT